MTVDEVLAELERVGSEQTRRTYRRHGVQGDLFGVLYSDFGRLKKKVKTDHELALALWESGNYDARIFALMIADPMETTEKQINAWIKDVDNYSLSRAFGEFVAKTRFARKMFEKWIESKEEWVSAAGWMILSHLPGDPTLPDSWFIGYIDRIVKTIHAEKNRVRYEMNGALIAIGVRNEALMELAIAAANRIGKVTVDHGDTNCKTPNAAEYIAKTMERKRKKG